MATWNGPNQPLISGVWCTCIGPCDVVSVKLLLLLGHVLADSRVNLLSSSPVRCSNIVLVPASYDNDRTCLTLVDLQRARPVPGSVNPTHMVRHRCMVVRRRGWMGDPLAIEPALLVKEDTEAASPQRGARSNARTCLTFGQRRLGQTTMVGSTTEEDL